MILDELQNYGIQNPDILLVKKNLFHSEMYNFCLYSSARVIYCSGVHVAAVARTMTPLCYHTVCGFF